MKKIFITILIFGLCLFNFGCNRTKNVNLIQEVEKNDDVKLGSTDTYSTPGSYEWQAPAGVTSVQIECWAAGGAGGGGTTASYAYGGGGGGAYCRDNSYTVTPGNYYTIVVGDGTTSGKGGDSYLDEGDQEDCYAYGGNAGSGLIGGAGGSAFSGYGDVTIDGGDGGGGRNSISYGSGGGGGSAGDTNAGGDGGDAVISAPGTAGTGGTNGGGDGGAGVYAAGNNNGLPGNTPGGGGGGGKNSNVSPSSVGGSGADGKCILTYTSSGGSTSCTAPASGDWYVQASDNCYVSANTTVQGTLFIINTKGPGTFNVIDGAILAVHGIKNTSTPVRVETGSKITFDKQ